PAGRGGGGGGGGIGGAVLPPPGLEIEPAADALARAGGIRPRVDRPRQHVRWVAPRDVHQPEVTRLAALLLAFLLVIPVAQAAWSGLLGGAFLLEFLTGGGSPAASTLPAAPTRQPLPIPGTNIDLYVRPDANRGTPLVLVHGFSPDGKDDPRVREAAALLSRAGFDVAVPTIPGLTRGRLGPEDVEPVGTTLTPRPAPARA